MEVYFNVSVEQVWGSILLTVLLYLIMFVILIDGIISFDFKLFVHSVIAFQFIHQMSLLQVY